MMNKNSVTTIWQSFLKLINERTGRFIANYEERSGSKFEPPGPMVDTIELDRLYHITIPGYFGGYSYFFEKCNDELIMYANLTSRWQWHEEDYEYFEITAGRYRELKGDECRDLANRISVLGKEKLRSALRKDKRSH